MFGRFAARSAAAAGGECDRGGRAPGGPTPHPIPGGCCLGPFLTIHRVISCFVPTLVGPAGFPDVRAADGTLVFFPSCGLPGVRAGVGV